MCRSGTKAIGNFTCKGSVIIPSCEKQLDMLQEKTSSSRFITAPSPWMVRPIRRRKSQSLLFKQGWLAHGLRVRICSHQDSLEESSKLPSSTASKKDLDGIVAMAWIISWGRSTLTGTCCTLTLSICKGIWITYDSSWNPNKAFNQVCRSRSQFWRCLPSEPRVEKAFTASAGMSWSATMPVASSQAALIESFPRPIISVILATVWEGA